jgi:hypothetical protein
MHDCGSYPDIALRFVKICAMVFIAGDSGNRDRYMGSIIGRFSGMRDCGSGLE